MNGGYTWTLRVTVDPTWVADGFDPDAGRWKDIIKEGGLQYAFDHEVEVEVVRAPCSARVRREQGYTDTVVDERDPVTEAHERLGMRREEPRIVTGDPLFGALGKMAKGETGE